MKRTLDLCSVFSQVNHIKSYMELQAQISVMRRELPKGWRGGETSRCVEGDLEECETYLRNAVKTIAEGLHHEISPFLGNDTSIIEIGAEEETEQK